MYSNTPFILQRFHSFQYLFIRIVNRFVLFLFFLLQIISYNGNNNQLTIRLIFFYNSVDAYDIYNVYIQILIGMTKIFRTVALVHH